jgi:hypothetical protein
MFAQVIQGRVTDAAGLRRQWEKWEPGACGYLGSTAGVTPDGEFIVVARFENEGLHRRPTRPPSRRPVTGCTEPAAGRGLTAAESAIVEHVQQRAVEPGDRLSKLSRGSGQS